MSKEKEIEETVVQNEATNTESSVENTAPVITVEQIKEVSERIETLDSKRRELEAKKEEFDVHMKDLENIKTLYGETSKQFEAKKGVVEITDSELKKLEDEIDNLSFKRSELKPYLDAATDLFDKERMAQVSREYHIEVGNRETFNQLMDFCDHSMVWTSKTAPALMTLATNLKENRAFVRSKDFDGVIILRSGNVLALQDFMLNKMEGKGWNTAKDFLACWANCGKNIGETVRQIQKEYESARTYAKYLENIDSDYDKSENDLEEEPLTTKEEVAAEL